MGTTSVPPTPWPTCSRRAGLHRAQGLLRLGRLRACHRAPDGKAVLSCLMLAVEADGPSTTIEASPPTTRCERPSPSRASPVTARAAVWLLHAGLVMAARLPGGETGSHSGRSRGPLPTNLCRCGCYQAITLASAGGGGHASPRGRHAGRGRDGTAHRPPQGPDICGDLPATGRCPVEGLRPSGYLATWRWAPASRDAEHEALRSPYPHHPHRAAITPLRRKPCQVSTPSQPSPTGVAALKPTTTADQCQPRHIRPMYYPNLKDASSWVTTPPGRVTSRVAVAAESWRIAERRCRPAGYRVGAEGPSS